MEDDISILNGTFVRIIAETEKDLDSKSQAELVKMCNLANSFSAKMVEYITKKDVQTKQAKIDEEKNDGDVV